ncbi:MAG: metal-sulfur cluster assembly factor [Candidatus Diapherotrites archaeon]
MASKRKTRTRRVKAGSAKGRAKAGHTGRGSAKPAAKGGRAKAGSAAGGTEAKIREKLRLIIDPHTGIDIVEMGLVKKIEVKGGKATVHFTPTTVACPVMGYFLQKIKELAESVPGVEKAEVVSSTQ